MLRRLLPTLAALVCGLVALFWGLASLQRLFSQEREEARAQLRTSREALEESATTQLRHRLARRLEGALPALHAAMGDPLAPGEGYYLAFRGRQFLPRDTLPAPGADTPAQAQAQALARALARPEEGVPERWRARLTLVREVERALERPGNPRVPERVEALLREHATHPLPVVEELPFVLLLLERLGRGPATPPLVRALVREGLPEDLGGIQRSAGLQRDLLRARERLTAADFDFLLARTVKVSRALGEPADALLARAHEADAGRLVLPEGLTGPTLLGERWYLEPGTLAPEEEPVVRGVAVDLDALLSELAAELRARGLFGADGRVRLQASSGVLPLDALRLEVSVPPWDAAEADLERRHGLKTLLVATCGALAVAIGVLAVVAQRGRYRYVELKSDFVATVSHELRTPLASIRLLAETLERKLAHAPPETRVYPERILQATDGLGFLVENILSFNRIDKGRWRPRPTDIPMEELIGMLRADLGHAAVAVPSVPVELTSSGGEAVLRVDPSLMRLLFVNLARNACAYNRRAPVRLDVRAYPSVGQGCVVMFSDNGIGIPEAEWENVFRDFHRLDTPGPELHGGGHGSGLGLALCRKIMTLHAGRITVDHSSPEGTTFCLLFPEPRT